MRRRILAALIATSARSDAFERLRVRPTLVHEVARNTHLGDVPAQPVLDVYAGPLYQGLDPTSLSSAARKRAATSLIVTSALWGAVRSDDRIPAYRLHVCSRLAGMDRLEPTWRTVLPAVLAGAAGARGVILDLRSPTYQAVGKPSGLAQRDRDHPRPAGSRRADHRRCGGQAPARCRWRGTCWSRTRIRLGPALWRDCPGRALARAAGRTGQARPSVVTAHSPARLTAGFAASAEVGPISADRGPVTGTAGRKDGLTHAVHAEMAAIGTVARS